MIRRLMKCQTVDPARGMFIVDPRARPGARVAGQQVYEDRPQREHGVGMVFTVASC